LDKDASAGASIFRGDFSDFNDGTKSVLITKGEAVSRFGGVESRIGVKVWADCDVQAASCAIGGCFRHAPGEALAFYRFDITAGLAGAARQKREKDKGNHLILHRTLSFRK
jgi:hypothetical protein